MRLTSILAAALLTAPLLTGADAADSLFEDKIIAQGKGVKVTSNQFDEALIAFKASRAGSGQPVPANMAKAAEEQILDRLIATQILMARATPEDKAAAKTVSDKFIAEAKSKALNQEAFVRQIRSMGLTLDKFARDVMEQSIVKVVIDRELKSKEVVTDERIKKFYDDNPNLFQEPDQTRAAHILFSTRDPVTHRDLPDDLREEKRKAAEKALARAKAGEDFSKLVKELSDDYTSAERSGEYTFAKGVMGPEFEGAAANLAINQVSDLVTTRFGFHIIKLLEKIPAHKSEFDKVKDKIKEAILQEETQKKLKGWIDQLRKEAGVEVIEAAKQ